MPSLINVILGDALVCPVYYNISSGEGIAE